MRDQTSPTQKSEIKHLCSNLRFRVEEMSDLTKKGENPKKTLYCRRRSAKQQKKTRGTSCLTPVARGGSGAKAPPLAARPYVASCPGLILPNLLDEYRKLGGYSVLFCFIKPILGNRNLRSWGFIVREPRETHQRSEIADVPTSPRPPLHILIFPHHHLSHSLCNVYLSV